MSGTPARASARRRRCAVVGAGAITLVVALVGLNAFTGRADAVSASDLGYPYPNAPDCNEQTGANCINDMWAFTQGQCHSWAAYRLNELNATQLNGATFNNTYKQPPGQTWGGGGAWKASAERAGITVDTTPALGSIAWWAADGGHVAYVEALNADGSIQISEMNADFHNGFDFATLQHGGRWPDSFLHIADRSSGAGTTTTTSSTTTTTVRPTTTTTVRPTTTTTSRTTTTSTTAPHATTTTTVRPTTTTTAPPVAATHTSRARAGYWLLEKSGNVYAFGGSRYYGGLSLPGHSAAPGSASSIVPTPSGSGYFVVSARAVDGFGDAYRIGTPSGLIPPGDHLVGLSVFPRPGRGYWMYTAHGRVIPRSTDGSYTFYGDVHNLPLNGPVVGGARTSNGRGYYMVASDGAVFAFGNARFYGSMGGRHLNAPIVAIVPTADNRGYWLVASDGGLFAFGDAPFRGSLVSTGIHRTITGMVRYGNGYLMVANEGSVFDFSSRAFLGSLAAHPPASPITSIAGK